MTTGKSSDSLFSRKDSLKNKILQMIKKLLLLISVLIFCYSSGFTDIHSGSEYNIDTSKADNDGPYVFYKDGKIIAKSIISNKEGLNVSSNTYSLEEKNKIEINCTFKEYPAWNFSTKLKNNLNNEPVIYPEVEKIFAISDIEGNFEALRKLLISNDVIDENYNWIFGNGHLVIAGDLFDRGLNVTEVLWLIYSLEEKAKEKGGYVHFILGNHELMNMNGNTKYVRNKYIENAVLLKEDYKNLFSAGTELGRWLTTKNVIEKIGNNIFVHGGISDEILETGYSLNEINDVMRKYYFLYDSVKKTNDVVMKNLFSTKKSLYWYRGYFDSTATKEQVLKTLSKYDASRIIVGHTIVENVTLLYDGSVIAIDTDHAAGISQSLFIESNKFYRTDEEGKRAELK